ncbi:TPA: response regulator [Candidatus Poribacteria bacterium]|nr:response regulator [Candidatus Poribacteria bacterium]
MIPTVNGKSALDYVNNNPVDVALVDIKMPDIDGIEVLKQIKQIQPHIEVIIITAFASVENAKNAIKYGAMDYLVKPPSVRELQATVRKAIAKRIQRMQYDEKLSGLLQVSQSIVSSLDTQDVKKNILDWVEKLFQAQMVWLALYNSQSEEFELTETRGPILKAFSDVGKGIIEAVIAEKQTIITPDVMTDKRIRYKDIVLDSEIKSIVGLPLMVRDKVIGVLGFSSPQFEDKQSIETTEMNFLTIFANHAAIALENARLYSDLKASEQKLQKSLEQVTASLEEKEVLLSEIHHRVKNNMQIISSMLRLQGRYIKDETYLQIFKDSQNRIRSMALIHEKLCQSENMANIDLDSYIRDLANSLYRTYAIAENVELKIDVENVSLSIDSAIPCGLIINELISNALKYAFPNGREGEISINFRRIGDEVELVVKDNGIGMPQDLDLKHVESLGLQLVTTLVENQLRGNLELSRTEGTEFRITFK